MFKSIRYSCFRWVHTKFLYFSKFDLTAKSLVTNSVGLTRVLCRCITKKKPFCTKYQELTYRQTSVKGDGSAKQVSTAFTGSHSGSGSHRGGLGGSARSHTYKSLGGSFFIDSIVDFTVSNSSGLQSLV